MGVGVGVWVFVGAFEAGCVANNCKVSREKSRCQALELGMERKQGGTAQLQAAGCSRKIYSPQKIEGKGPL